MWLFNNKQIKEIPENTYGFIYKITDNNNKIYFGKKAFLHKRKVKLGKKAKLLPENKGKRILITQKDSNWLNYYGSCIPLKNHIKTLNKDEFNKIKREIICFCKTKQDLTYRELEVLIKENVLFRDDCWNSNILSKFFKGKIN